MTFVVVSPVPVATGVGIDTEDVDPVPNLPVLPLPQQYAAPVVVTAHVELYPAATELTFEPLKPDPFVDT